MNKKDIKGLLTNHFNNDRQPISYEALVPKLRLARRDKAELKKELERMVASGELIKRRGRYSPAPPKKAQKIIPRAAVKANMRLIEGKFDATSLSRDQSYAFVRTDGGDYFVDFEDTLNAFHNDIVAIETIRGRSKDRAIVRKIIKRSNETMAGDIKYLSNKPIFICSNPKIHRWFEVNDTLGAKENDKVVLEVTNWGNIYSGKMPGGKVVEVLGPSGDVEVELLAVLRQYQLPLEFPIDVIAETDALKQEIEAKDFRSREDLRDLLTFTIDPASAKDFDDAISLEADNQGYKLWVHIADVSHFVALDSKIFKEASKRGNSFYFPKQVIPMLPPRLSNQICSLRPNEDKLCLSVFTQFDLKGNIRNQKIVQSVIRSDYRLAYEEVDAYFDGEDSQLSPILKKTLSDALKLSKLLSQRRISEGYIFFDLPEIQYEYDDDGLLVELGLDKETDGHKLIENFMLVANEYVAKRLKQLAPHTLYRIHENPDPQKLERLGVLISHYGLSFDPHEDPNLSLQYLLNSMPNKDYHMVFDRMVLRSLKKAQYTIKEERHFGLGLEHYTHFTSPIRRLCDLCIHHLCKIYLLKTSKASLNAFQLRNHAQTANEQELLADEAERSLERVYSLAFMKKKVGERFTGTVISTRRDALIVRLTEIPVTGVLKTDTLKGSPFTYHEQAMMHASNLTGNYYQLLDKVIVDIMDVSDDIYLELAQVPGAHTHYSAEFSPHAFKKVRQRQSKEIKSKRLKRVDQKRGSDKSVRYKRKSKKARRR